NSEKREASFGDEVPVFDKDAFDAASPAQSSPTPQGGDISPLIGSLPGDTPEGKYGTTASWHSVLSKLGPDHALLRPFQEAKRKQLQEEKSNLILKLRQLKQQTGDLEKDNVVLGTKLFHFQQEVTRAQVALDAAKPERAKMATARANAQE
ncbi:unnamed protein product, partial [Meganyctiphanes norvegica]